MLCDELEFMCLERVLQQKDHSAQGGAHKYRMLAVGTRSCGSIMGQSGARINLYRKRAMNGRVSEATDADTEHSSVPATATMIIFGRLLSDVV